MHHRVQLGLSQQGSFGIDFYEELGKTYYNETIGKILKINNDKKSNTSDLYLKSLAQQLTLHCDPAVRIHGFESRITPLIMNLFTYKPKNCAS
ncbi:MAG: hypothetical protein R2766_03810 [Saprospiraceae bacterium]